MARYSNHKETQNKISVLDLLPELRFLCVMLKLTHKYIYEKTHQKLMYLASISISIFWRKDNILWQILSLNESHWNWSSNFIIFEVNKFFSVKSIYKLFDGIKTWEREHRYILKCTHYTYTQIPTQIINLISFNCAFDTHIANY